MLSRNLMQNHYQLVSHVRPTFIQTLKHRWPQKLHQKKFQTPKSHWKSSGSTNIPDMLEMAQKLSSFIAIFPFVSGWEQKRLNMPLPMRIVRSRTYINANPLGTWMDGNSIYIAARFIAQKAAKGAWKWPTGRQLIVDSALMDEAGGCWTSSVWCTVMGSFFCFRLTRIPRKFCIENVHH